MSRRKRALLAALLVLALVGAVVSGAAFVASSSNATNTFGAASDYVGPTVNAAVISPTSSGTPTGVPGFVKQGGTYKVYANASDSNSGVASATADISAVTTAASAAPLTFDATGVTVGGTTYHYVSANQTATNPLAEGAKSFSVTATDNAQNSATPGSFNVTVDNTAPAVSASVISPTSSGNPTGTPGFVAQGGTYKVYANASDGSSGVQSATADVSSVTTGATGIALTFSGPGVTVGGTTYHYVSADQTAKNPLSEGSKGYTVSAKDNAQNTGSSSLSVTVDNTAPTVPASVISRTSSGNPTGPTGFVTQGGTYKVYANLSDSGSGAASATTNVSSLTTGATAVTLTFSSPGVTVGGTTYHWISAEQTVKSSLSEGSKSYSVAGTDNLGNTATTSGFSATVDNTGPTVPAAVISQTSSGTPTGPAGFVGPGETYRVYANLSDGSGSGVAGATANVNNITSSASAVPMTFDSTGVTVGGTTYHWISTEQTAKSSIGDGSKSYSVTGTDNVAIAATTSLTVTADSTGPSVPAAVVSPTASGSPVGSPGFVKQGGTYRVYANLSDGSGSGVASASADVHNLTTGATAVGMTFDATGVSVGGTVYHWVTTEQTVNNPLGSGSKNFTVGGTDNAANTDSTGFNVTVDNTAPTTSASVISPTASGNPTGAPGFVAQGGTYKVYANVTDSSSGVASATASLANLTSGASAVTLTFSSPGVSVGGTTYHWISGEQTAGNPLSEGAKSYSVTATDNAQNTATPASFSATVDNTAPTVSLTVPVSPLTGSKTLTATASDAGAGLLNLKVQYKLSAVSTWTDAPNSNCSNNSSPVSCSFNTSNFPDGTYDFRAVATDNATNSNTNVVTGRVLSNNSPTGTDVQTHDVAGTQGLAQLSDTATLIYSEEMDTTSILAGWTSASTPQNVTVRIVNSGTQDTLEVWNATNTTQVPLGTVSLKSDYVTASATFGGPGATTQSTMVGAVQSDGTEQITLTLGNRTSGTLQTAQSSTSKATWVPSATAKDLGGNAVSTNSKTSTVSGPQF